MATLELEQIRAKLVLRGWPAQVSGLGGNVVGLVVDVPGVASDQCVLFTIDDGLSSGTVGLSECEVAANYHDGTVGLTEDNAGRRFVLGDVDRTTDQIVVFVRLVSELGGDVL